MALTDNRPEEFEIRWSGNLMKVFNIMIDDLEHRFWYFALIERIECFDQPVIIPTSIADV